MPPKQSPMDIYAQIQALVQKEARDQALKVYKEQGNRYGIAKVPLHYHNNIDSPNIPSQSIIQGARVCGDITMAQANVTYQIATPFKPRSIIFNGIVYNNSGVGITIRALVNGRAELGTSYYLQPGTATTVIAGTQLEKVIQSYAMLLVDSSGANKNAALANDQHIISVTYNGTIVARATVTGYSNGYVNVYTDTLGAGWEIQGAWTII